MSVIGFLLLMMFAWFFYNLLVKVILPVYKTARQIRRQFKNMSSHRTTEDARQQSAKPSSAPKSKVGEYIDFEEVS